MKVSVMCNDVPTNSFYVEQHSKPIIPSVLPSSVLNLGLDTFTEWFPPSKYLVIEGISTLATTIIWSFIPGRWGILTPAGRVKLPTFSDHNLTSLYVTWLHQYLDVVDLDANPSERLAGSELHIVLPGVLHDTIDRWKLLTLHPLGEVSHIARTVLNQLISIFQGVLNVTSPNTHEHYYRDFPDYLFVSPISLRLLSTGLSHSIEVSNGRTIAEHFHQSNLETLRWRKIKEAGFILKLINPCADSNIGHPATHLSPVPHLEANLTIQTWLSYHDYISLLEFANLSPGIHYPSVHPVLSVRNHKSPQHSLKSELPNHALWYHSLSDLLESQYVVPMYYEIPVTITWNLTKVLHFLNTPIYDSSNGFNLLAKPITEYLTNLNYL
jgi:hypothetical protein